MELPLWFLGLIGLIVAKKHIDFSQIDTVFFSFLGKMPAYQLHIVCLALVSLLFY